LSSRATLINDLGADNSKKHVLKFYLLHIRHLLRRGLFQNLFW